MKKKNGSGLIIFSLVFISISLFLNSINRTGQSMGTIIICAFFLSLGVLFLVFCSRMLLFSIKLKRAKKTEDRIEENNYNDISSYSSVKKDRTPRVIAGKHMSGLNGLATGTDCKLIFNEDHIFIEGGGGSFRLSFEKIVDVTITTDVEFQKSYVSSVGGAVGGAAILGTVGAMIGGRAKEKTSRVVEHYAIVSYVKDGAIDCLSFHLPPLSSTNANNIIGRYRDKFQGKAETQEL